MVVGVKYCNTKECWYAETRVAKQDEVDDRKHSVVNAGSPVAKLYVGNGRKGRFVGKCIRYYNKGAGLE